MGLFTQNCTNCGQVFLWHSSNLNQICGDCLEKAGGGYYIISVLPENDGDIGKAYMVEKNILNRRNVLLEKFNGKSDEYRIACKYLVNERGVNKNKIQL